MGALGMALAGGLTGLGKGMVREAEVKRESQLMALKRQWQKEDDATARAQQVEDRDLRFAQQEKLQDKRTAARGLGRGGGGGRSRAKDPKLSASLEVSLAKQFKDKLGETDWSTVNTVQDEVYRLMTEEGLTETAAKRRALNAMVFEETEGTGEYEGGLDIPLLGNIGGTEKEESIRNKSRIGTFTGEFDYGETRGEAPVKTGEAPVSGGLSGQGSPDVSRIPEGAKAALRANPDLADQFDAKYGAGAAAAILGR